MTYGEGERIRKIIDPNWSSASDNSYDLLSNTPVKIPSLMEKL